MKRMTATEFKAKCLDVMDQVKESGEPVEITKHGKPVALLTRIPPARQFAKPGFAAGEARIVGDILEPLEVEWDVLQ